MFLCPREQTMPYDEEDLYSGPEHPKYCISCGGYDQLHVPQYFQCLPCALLNRHSKQYCIWCGCHSDNGEVCEDCIIPPPYS